MNFIVVALCLLLTLDGALSECPGINDKPVLNDAGDEFYCSWKWHDLGSSEPLDGCNGEEEYFMDDYDHSADEGGYTPFGSILVKAGCTLYGYELHNFTGDYDMKYVGPNVFPDGCIGSKCPPNHAEPSKARGFSSFKCRCTQEPIICNPEDGWVEIMQCDNTQSNTTLVCSYTKQIGTTWSSSATESMDIDVTIKADMSAKFFDMFSADIGVSVSTGYDWTHTSAESKEEIDTYHVKATVPPHTLLKIQGAEGNCKESGGKNNNVKTEMFKSITMDAEGNVIFENIEKFDPVKEYVVLVDDTMKFNE